MSDPYSLAKVSIDDTRMELKCVVAIPVVGYLTEVIGEQRMMELIHETEMNVDYLLNANNWISFDYYCRLLKKVVDVTGNPDAPFEAARLHTDRASFRSVGFFLMHLGTPGNVYKLVVQWHSLWDKLCEYRMLKMNRDSCRIAVRYIKYQQDRNNCMVLKGCLAAIPLQFGLPCAVVEEDHCACDGNDECIYNIKWVNKPQQLWGTRGLLLGMVAGLLVLMAGKGHPLAVVFAGLMMMTAYFIGRITDYKYRLRDVYLQNEEQGNSLLEAIRATEDLNEELGKRVAERTEELTQANEDLQREIAERKKAENALLSAYSKHIELRRIIDRSPAVAFLWRNAENWPVEYVSDNVHQLGYTPDDFYSEKINFKDLIYKDDRTRVELDTRRYRQLKHDHFSQEYRLLTRHGNIIWVNDHTWLRRDESGTITHLEGLVLDITERKHMEQALEEAKEAAEESSKMKSQFLANMSHEIRTPLNSIIGFSELVLESRDQADIYAKTRTVLKETKTLLSLINDLLDHAKIEAGKLQLEVYPFNLHTLLHSITSTASVQAVEKKLEYRLDIHDNVPECVKGDSLRLYQIIINLVTNALKFTMKGSVCVSVEAVATHEQIAQIRFSVIDTGIGMSDTEQKRIFDSFTQADGSTTRKFGGTGLGTTIARELVELMGGTMGLKSSLNKGSTFWFAVPLAICDDVPDDDALLQLTRDEPCSSLLSVEPGIHGRILVAEDYSLNQEIARLHLESVGHEVRIVSNGREAIDAAYSTQYDLILMDIQMPEMDGYEAMRHIRSVTNPCQNALIVALTANADAETQHACAEVGATGIITKPIRRVSFLNEINRLLSTCSETSLNRAEPCINPSIKGNGVVLDYDRAVQEFGNNQELLDRVLQRFLHKSGEQVETLRVALDQGDMEKLNREAHRIRGAAANLTAERLSSAAEVLETCSGKKDKTMIESAVKQVNNEFEVLLEAYSELKSDVESENLEKRT